MSGGMDDGCEVVLRWWLWSDVGCAINRRSIRL